MPALLSGRFGSEALVESRVLLTYINHVRCRHTVRLSRNRHLTVIKMRVSGSPPRADKADIREGGSRVGNHWHKAYLTTSLAFKQLIRGPHMKKTESSDTFTRRDFFKRSGATAVSVSSLSLASAAAAAPGSATGGTASFPRTAVGRAKAMKTHEVVAFRYPDAASPCAAIKLGAPVAGGVGPDRDIVAYSTLCTHMGCPLQYNGDGAFKCRCHYSQFDIEKQGQMICGQATENLPRITLHYDAKNDTLTAVGIDGLIYGRQSNLI
jgi:arsenite oxidase small subunit